jgi:RNase P subunit RPR2
MTVNNTELGLCPRCEQPVPSTELLIDYESKRGERVVVAKCTECVAVVTLL